METAAEDESLGVPTATARRRPPFIVTSFAAAAAVAFIALLVYGVRQQAPDGSINDALAAGRPFPAPTFELPILTTGQLGPKLTRSLRASMADGKLSSAELRGTAFALNVWASWCDPCRDEAPVLRRAWREARRDGALVLGIDIQDATSDGRRFLSRYNLDYPNLRDPGNTVSRRYRATGVPETFFVSATGEIVDHVIGVIDAAGMRRGMAAATSGRVPGARP